LSLAAYEHLNGHVNEYVDVNANEYVDDYGNENVNDDVDEDEDEYVDEDVRVDVNEPGRSWGFMSFHRPKWTGPLGVRPVHFGRAERRK
jgi:hypothetical protein